MNKQSWIILYELIKYNKVSEKQLETTLGLTKRKIQYGIQLINYEAEKNNIPEILKKGGIYYLEQEFIDYYSQKKNKKNVYYLKKEERIYFIVLMILIRVEELSLEHFVYELGVSKNTIWDDIKKSYEVLEDKKLEIKFNKKMGYYIKGKEWDKRYMIFFLLRYFYENYGEEPLNQVFKNEESRMNAIKEKICEVEKKLMIYLTDTDYNILLYSITSVFIRIEKEAFIENIFSIKLNEISDTKEFKSTEIIFENFQNISAEERLFMALQILTSSSVRKEVLDETELPKLQNALWEFINEFEKNTLLFIKDKNLLMEVLLKHFKPAYYRIKYKLITEYKILDKVISEYKLLFNFVQIAKEPLEKYFGCEIPEQELAFISLCLGGHIVMEDSTEIIQNSIKAVILCSSGTSVSRLMYFQLKSIFPEFIFYPAMAIRELENFKSPYDIIFSTVPVASKHDVFLINAIMNDVEKIQLRKKVIGKIYNLVFESPSTLEIIKIVEKYTEIKDEKNLKRELNKRLFPKEEQVTDDDKDVSRYFDIHSDGPDLISLLENNMIQIIDSVESWEHAIYKASSPLLEKDIITPNYLENLIVTYEDRPEFLVLNRNIAIPHLAASYGVKNLGMSFLLVKNGINYSDEINLNMIVVIAAPDKSTHLKALYQVMKIAKDNEMVNLLCKCNEAEEISSAIYKFLNN